MDLLAEALQNATDAIDTRSETERRAPRKIEIAFDAQRGEFSVTDTGVGMPLHELKLALAPNISFKTGELARPRRLRARGEKGVGLSFMALACNALRIRTCDGKRVLDASIDGANDWLREGERGPSRRPAPPCNYSVEEGSSPLLGSRRWTTVTVAAIDHEHFGENLFETRVRDLVWHLRTATAVGNTAYLFTKVGRPQPEEILVSLRYTSARGTKTAPKKVPYRYLSPAEFLPPERIVEFDDVKHLDAFERRQRLRGKALRFVDRDERSGERFVDVYAIVMDGREMRRILKERQRSRKVVPPDLDWQGFELAVREMPAGVRLEPGMLGTRAWEGRLFMLLQYDDLALDLGRKTIAARTRQMLNGVATKTWNGKFGTVARQVQPSPRLTVEGGREALRAKIERAKALPPLDASIPYLKEAASVEATQAIFHELVAGGSAALGRFAPLNTRIFAQQDALVYPLSPNGTPPLHVIFGLYASEIVNDLDGDAQYGATADLAIVWEVDDEKLAELGLQAQELVEDERPDAATHLIELGGIGRREEIRLLALREIVRSEG